MIKTISDISKSFVSEALSSPKMLEDLAAMEKYLAESYDGRTFTELLQNADDAKSSRVKVFQTGDTLIVANDGKPFDEKDVMAICRSGASSKQRGNSIGYRGVGFKSSTSISTEIIIHSASAYFTFSKRICAKKLNMREDQVPTVRIPFLYDNSELSAKTRKFIENSEKDGFTTFFIFLKANIGNFIKELEGFNTGWFIFLKHISEVSVECNSIIKKCLLKRRKLSDYEILLSVDNSDVFWYIVTENDVSIAFKYDSIEGIIPCGADEAVFHCFLPTLDKTGFPFKANGDFSTDPSRKHIIRDDSTNKTIEYIQLLYADVVSHITHDKKTLYYPILSLLNTHTALNYMVTQLEGGLLEKLRVSEWVPLNDGQYTKPSNTRFFPKWLDTSEKELICAKVPSLASGTPHTIFAQKVDRLDVLLSKLGATEITVRELSDILTNVDYVQQFPARLLAKIFSYCYRLLSREDEIIGKMFVPLSTGYVLLTDTSSEAELNSEFLSVITSILNTKELNNLATVYAAFTILRKNQHKPSVSASLKKLNFDGRNNSAKTTQLAINKWKTPLQNCMAIEALSGHMVKNVEKEYNGYSVISTEPNGKVSYIAVKTVRVLGDSFMLSESEYSAAQQFGDGYKVYLFTTVSSTIEYTVIVNPIDTLKMKKVVKEWEWLCESYEFNNSQGNDNDECELQVEDSLDFNDFECMDGEQFERFCAQLLIKNGYEEVLLTKGSGDQGIDIIAYKDNIKYGIQCKCYSSNVGNSAVQEAFSGKAFYGCNIGIVLTNRYFSASAVQLAESNGIVLWDRHMLLKLIKSCRRERG